ncbi:MULTISPECIES: TRAP transporter small permease subunit [unclassified Pseudovibrio]|uniref:TRAP transporter small permease n=1 Tax=unclassified Pseudovibrio TaxID=2627060 RepID=UPI0007AE944E|nr:MULTISPECIES: TRAP transporter small permease subunit [unclassified Pseudovibrio]KZL03595.1 2,3-diketo-L-gulonate TRAP transporter small permease protein YiaM [Pseudovibrio sp. W74]KZL09691.1 2,3-diketo-L-gulonate TRAP transporter small permease protein YiaM [Pseudovibrio sp. Ad14]
MDRLMSLLLTGLICLVALGQFVQVITRYLLEIPVLGLEESLLYPTMWLYMVGAVNASRENSHIRANVLEIFLKTPKQVAVLALVGEALSLAIGCWLTYWAWDFTKYSMRVWRESPTLYIPTFYVDIALITGLVLMMVFTAIQLGRHIHQVLTGTFPEPLPTTTESPKEELA